MTVPVVVIGGYLGAGKTTLVNALLRAAAGRRIAVLVNDFGDIAIDADLIEGADGGVLALTGGCVCCAFGADLVGSLESLRDRDPAPDIVLIETSGVGLPGAVARSVTLAAGMAAIGVVVMADAETVRAQAADRYVGDTVLAQLAAADLILLSKADRVADADLAAVQAFLVTAAPNAPVIRADHGAAPADLVLGPRPRAGTDEDPAAHAHFETGVRRFEGPVDLATLAADLTGAGLARAKGVLTDLEGRRRTLQIVGRRAAITDAPASARVDGEVVWIRVKS